MPHDRQPGPRLRVLNGPLMGTLFDVKADSTVIGRNKDCQIVLASNKVSKRHAEIRREGTGYFVQDLKSLNDTLVNGAVIKHPTRLRDGDHVTICEFSFIFQHAVVTVQKDDEGSSTIIGSIEIKTSSTYFPKVRPEDTLKALLEIIRDIGNSLHYRDVLDRTLGSLFNIFPQANRGFVLLKDSGAGVLTPQAIRFRQDESGPLTISTTVFAHVMDEGKAILSTNLSADPLFGQSPSLQGEDIRTMMCVPLFNGNRQPIGMIQIDTRDQHSRFSQDNLDMLAAIAGPVGLAVENARLHETQVRLSIMEASLKNAHEVQLALLPDTRPDLPGYEFWDYYEPAQSVGGDYFDYLPIGHDRVKSQTWAISIGDVAGKGMPAALLMAKLSSEVRTCLLTEPDPVRALERLNSLLYNERFPERFITFLLILLDSDQHRITIINAGHEYPIIRRASGEIETLGQGLGGPALAILETARYRTVETTLEPGDVVVLYTDGVSEAMNPEDRCLHARGIQHAMTRASGGAAAVGDAIVHAVRDHASTCLQSDDIGLVTFGRI